MCQLIFPILDYADVVYQNVLEANLKALNVAFNNICRFVLRCPFTTHHCVMYDSLKLLSSKARRQYHWYQVIFKCMYYNYPSYLKEYLIPYRPSYRLRHTDYLSFIVPNISKESGRRAFKFKAPSEWNSLPGSLRSVTSLCSFKISLFVYLQANCCCKCFPHVWLDFCFLYLIYGILFVLSSYLCVYMRVCDIYICESKGLMLSCILIL